MQVECAVVAIQLAHGARVRNTWVICPLMGNNPPKGGLIPRTLPGLRARKESCPEGVALKDGLMSYQLVGEVTAHQGIDG